LYWGAKCSIGRSEQKVLSETQSLSLAGVIEKLPAIKLPTGLGMLIVGVLASFHGYAHGVEMPQSASGLAYGSGFIMATTLLHTTGLGFATLVKNRKVIQWIGGVIALGGGYLFFNTFAGV
jgi:hydrogenase/urease accessory protein HupE